MRYALVVNGVVTNIIIWDGEGSVNTDGDIVAADDDAVIGGIYKDGVFIRP
jgi:hypothetical protein